MMLDGWNVDIASLWNPYRNRKRWRWPVYPSHSIFVSPTARRAAVLYDVDEVRMGWYSGFLAVFEVPRRRPVLILNPQDLWVHVGCKPITWLNAYMIAITVTAGNRETGRVQYPLLLLDLRRKQFSFVPVTNSGFYSFRLRGTSVCFRQLQRDFPSFDGDCFPLKNLPWYGFEQLDSFNKIFLRDTPFAAVGGLTEEYLKAYMKGGRLPKCREKGGWAGRIRRARPKMKARILKWCGVR